MGGWSGVISSTYSCHCRSQGTWSENNVYQSCAMARVVLSREYAVMSWNYCVQGIRFKTRHYALLMFVSYNTGVTFPWFSSDLVSESLESPSPWAVSYKNVQVARRACRPQESRIILLASRAALCQTGRPPFPWHPGVKGKSMGVTVGPLLQAQLQCHWMNTERKSRFQRVRTIHSVTLSGVISSGRAKEYSIFLSLWLKSGQWRCRFEAR